MISSAITKASVREEERRALVPIRADLLCKVCTIGLLPSDNVDTKS